MTHGTQCQDRAKRSWPHWGAASEGWQRLKGSRGECGGEPAYPNSPSATQWHQWGNHPTERIMLLMKTSTQYWAAELLPYVAVKREHFIQRGIQDPQTGKGKSGCPEQAQKQRGTRCFRHSQSNTGKATALLPVFTSESTCRLLALWAWFCWETLLVLHYPNAIFTLLCVSYILSILRSLYTSGRWKWVLL